MRLRQKARLSCLNVLLLKTRAYDEHRVQPPRPRSVSPPNVQHCHRSSSLLLFLIELVSTDSDINWQGYQLARISTGKDINISNIDDVRPYASSCRDESIFHREWDRNRIASTMIAHGPNLPIFKAILVPIEASTVMEIRQKSASCSSD